MTISGRALMHAFRGGVAKYAMDILDLELEELFKALCLTLTNLPFVMAFTLGTLIIG